MMQQVNKACASKGFNTGILHQTSLNNVVRQVTEVLLNHVRLFLLQVSSHTDKGLPLLNKSTVKHYPLNTVSSDSTKHNNC